MYPESCHTCVLCRPNHQVIKHGAIRSAAYFAELEAHVERVLALEPDAILSVVLQSIIIKCTVVVEDEKEGGLRALLNFGHSVGHAIEAHLTPQWLHGECVAVGMVREIEIARAVANPAPDALGRLLCCLKAYGLPTHAPDSLAPTAILEKMAVDKKNRGGVKYIVLIEAIGDAGKRAHPVPDAPILRVLSPGLVLLPPGRPLSAAVRVPGSKSISNRVLLMAALGKGTCVLRGLLHSDDTLCMMGALKSLGVADFEWRDGGHTLVIQGAGGTFFFFYPGLSQPIPSS